ncbi:MAG: hypothetical protein DRP57_09875 [Spirochaetes bacterium]|nr:MAG: hypothetical protein DRP57_09875 [Spirochaetota bacterium]
MKKEKKSTVFIFLLSIAVIFIMSGCQAVFTYSPLSFLQRDPSTLSAAEQRTYAENALASGDADAIAKAYDAIKALLKDNPDDPELNLLAAKLGVEVSGIPSLIDQIIQGSLDLSGPDALDDVSDFINSDSVDPQAMIDAGTYYKNAESSGELTSTDYIMGSLGILLGAASGEDLSDPGSWDTASQNEAQDAVDFLNKGIENLPADDPARDILTGFSDYLGNFTP